MPGSVIRDLLSAARQMDETMVSAFTAACSFQRLDLALVNPGTIQTMLVNNVAAAGGTAEEWSDGDLTTVRGAQKLRDWIMMKESWFKFYGRPETVMTDPEGCFRERLFREWLASKNVRWDPQPAEAAWRIGILDKVLDVLKNAATRAARRAPELRDVVRRLHRGSQRVASSERLFTFPTAHWSIPTWFATGW